MPLIQMHVIDYSKKKYAEKLHKDNFRIYKKLVEIYEGYDRAKKKDNFIQKINRFSRQIREKREKMKADEAERIQSENYKMCKRLLEIDYNKEKKRDLKR
jgi:hypothetical protein